MFLALTCSTLSFYFQDILSKVTRAQAAAQKDNDFIYHERVPNTSDLPAVGRAPVAKPTPVATEGKLLLSAISFKI